MLHRVFGRPSFQTNGFNDSMSNSFDNGDPFQQEQKPPSGSNAYIIAPAIGLLIVGLVGLAASVLLTIVSLTTEYVPPNNPDAPEEFLKFLENNGQALQVGLGVVGTIFSLLVILGGVCMASRKSYALSLLGASIAVINFGGCSCLLGAPIGLWAIIVLLQPETRARMRRAKAPVSAFDVDGKA